MPRRSRRVLLIMLASFVLGCSAVIVAADDPPRITSLTYSLSQDGTVMYEEICWMAAPAGNVPPDTWVVQQASRPVLSQPPGSVSWWFMNGEDILRYLVQRIADDGQEEIAELPAWVGARSLFPAFSEQVVAEAPDAEQTTITVPAGTYEVTTGTLAGVELWVSDLVPVRGLVRAARADGTGAIVELFAVSSEATSLLPDPLPPPRFAAEQKDQLPLGTR